jgi:putative hemolysin
MVKLVTLFISLMSFPFAFGCESKIVYTKTNGEKISLCFDQKIKGYVSETCTKSCQARKFLNQIVPIKVKELKGGKDPHSVACVKRQGKLNLYRDEKGNEYAFCESPDGSAVSADLIGYNLW